MTMVDSEKGAFVVSTAQKMRLVIENKEKIYRVIASELPTMHQSPWK